VSAGLTWFNELTVDAAITELTACCASRSWAEAVASGRPYPDLVALLTTADAALDRLAWADIAQALAAHPRIGRPAAGATRDAAWSRREQAAVADADAEVRAALADANRDYEQRFGRVFLVFANGRSPAELLAAAHARLGNDEATERAVVRAELAKITRLRLARLVSSEDPT
jgi:2-oxo-4-hydroxy-4-carboxy-5-ureidoimidazoline decarboxylase